MQLAKKALVLQEKNAPLLGWECWYRKCPWPGPWASWTWKARVLRKPCISVSDEVHTFEQWAHFQHWEDIFVELLVMWLILFLQSACVFESLLWSWKLAWWCTSSRRPADYYNWRGLVKIFVYFRGNFQVPVWHGTRTLKAGKLM